MIDPSTRAPCRFAAGAGRAPASPVPNADHPSGPAGRVLLSCKNKDRDALGDQAILRAEAVRASSHSDSPNSKRGPPLPMRVLALAVTAGVAYV